MRGGNPCRSKAYSRAADSLAALAVPLDVLIAEGRLTDIPGVGDAIADIIIKLHRAGTYPNLEKLRKEIPAGVLEMLTVPALASGQGVAALQGARGRLAGRTGGSREGRPHQENQGLGAALQTKVLVRWSQPLSKSWRQVKRLLKLSRADLTLYGTKAPMADRLDNEAIVLRRRAPMLATPVIFGDAAFSTRKLPANVEALELAVIEQICRCKEPCGYGRARRAAVYNL